MHHCGVIAVEFFGNHNLNQKFLFIYISKILFFLPQSHPEQCILKAEPNHMNVLKYKIDLSSGKVEFLIIARILR